jgi:hypothetical protein
VRLHQYTYEDLLVTSAIKESLTSLNTALQKLEMSASDMQDNRKVKAKSSSTDLFSIPQKSNNDIDAKAIASRLDGAIAKVEKLLREG